jgi:hypothetical protein
LYLANFFLDVPSTYFFIAMKMNDEFLVYVLLFLYIGIFWLRSLPELSHWLVSLPRLPLLPLGHQTRYSSPIGWFLCPACHSCHLVTRLDTALSLAGFSAPPASPPTWSPEVDILVGKWKQKPRMILDFSKS